MTRRAACSAALEVVRAASVGSGGDKTIPVSARWLFETSAKKLVSVGVGDGVAAVVSAIASATPTRIRTGATNCRRDTGLLLTSVSDVRRTRSLDLTEVP